MATASLPVVRVKRRITEEPLSAFVLNCKKPKLDESNNLEDEHKEISAVLKFAGTVENQNAPIEHITRITKDEAKQLAQKSRNPNLTEKSRQEMRQSLQESRFKVVNCHRTFEANAESISNPKEITIVDIEKQKAGPGVAASSEVHTENTQMQSFVPTDDNAGDGFVYDLYVPDHDQQLPDNVDYMEPYISVRPFDDLTLEDCYVNEDEDNDSEDSNQENYFANDYPDEDDYFSVDEEDMVKAVARCDLNSDNELSSDEEEGDSDSEHFIFSVPDTDNFREDDDKDDYYDFSDDERDDFGRRRIHYVDDDDEENEEYY